MTSNCERSPVSATEPLGPDQSLPVACVNILSVLVIPLADFYYIFFNWQC
jgi:hypothetical protein